MTLVPPDEPSVPATGPPSRRLGAGTAGALVFGSSAAVLVVEIVALRLLAPHLGLTLETSTLVIGLALAAIAAGSWAGGRWADAHDGRRALPLLLGVSGVGVAATPFLVRASAGFAGGGLLLPVAAATIVVPGTLLAAVTPVVTKLRLDSLTETGTVVGRLSAIGTTGAIVGTVVSGFVLISRLPVTWIMVGLGILLTLSAVVIAVGARQAPAITAAVVVLAGGTGAAIAPSGCDAETMYHCAVVVTDPTRETGRRLVLDGLSHSYVDLADPRHLEFSYIRALAGAVDATFPPGRPLVAHHLGGGGLTLPRYLAEARPGTRSTVSEIDPGVVALDEERLGFRPGERVQVHVEDARTGLARRDTGSFDLVVGDAFGGVSVPWHLTTREAIGEVDRVLADGGLYAVNLIDNPPLAFARAELATLAATFENVALAAGPGVTSGRAGGNLVAVASHSPLDLASWRTGLADRGVNWNVIDGAALRTWIGDSPVLTDDYAPVDQLLTPYG